MSKRLEILKKSLEKKQAEFDRKLNTHIADVKRANGQPLNDKRNGHVTLNRWERQNDSLRNLKQSIEKTKDAIELEEAKIRGTETAKETMPKELINLIENGTITQWRKHPNTFFVNGVEKARMVWDAKKGLICHRYVSAITDKEQRRIFASVYNPLNEVLNNRL
ncbi:hypothetical protein [Dysgonomonas massiliensis]|uniref:hypothetical protein n=1 Tax=Dysgonomonas massiliensis TaxID=2040292 RepID=UPI000C75F171|nr:hypothetical protein [Dysgonomonas massiliensis]